MSDTTARFALPFIAAGQAQKELFHNEALAIVDAIAHPVAQTLGDTVPPASPTAGQCWIVGSAPVGAWAGHADALAAWTDGGWRFVSPTEGMTAWVAGLAIVARYGAGGWIVGDVVASRLVIDGMKVVGAQAAAIAAPAGGTVVDQPARDAIATIIAMLSEHGLIAK